MGIAYLSLIENLKISLTRKSQVNLCFTSYELKFLERIGHQKLFMVSKQVQRSCIWTPKNSKRAVVPQKYVLVSRKKKLKSCKKKKKKHALVVMLFDIFNE